MKALILFHPRMSGRDIAHFCWVHECAIRTRVYETRVFAWVDPTTQPPAQPLHPDTEFVCACCSWIGPHPQLFDTCDHYQPPLGEMPACPACGSYRVTLGVE